MPNRIWTGCSGCFQKNGEIHTWVVLQALWSVLEGLNWHELWQTASRTMVMSDPKHEIMFANRTSSVFCLLLGWRLGTFCVISIALWNLLGMSHVCLALAAREHGQAHSFFKSFHLNRYAPTLSCCYFRMLSRFDYWIHPRAPLWNQATTYAAVTYQTLHCWSCCPTTRRTCQTCQRVCWVPRFPSLARMPGHSQQWNFAKDAVGSLFPRWL